MYNSASKSSSNKRSFMPADVRKELGRYVKKPRLDVIFTPLTPHSVNKSPSKNCVKDPADELWGEELPEEAIEECELLATQAYQEASVSNTEKSKQTVKTNLSPRVSSGFLGSNNDTPITCNVSSAITNQRALGKTLSRSGSFVEGQDKKKNENEITELKEKCMQKEGEVAILRSQLKQLQLQLETQKLDHMKTLESQALKYVKQLNEQKKELDVTNTQLQFQIMEATSIRNHCKVLKSEAKIKLVEPKAIASDTPKKRIESKEEEQKRKFNFALPLSSIRNRKSYERSSEVLSIKEKRPLVFGIREGAVLGFLVNEYLTAKSQPDISWIHYLRKKQSLCRKIKEAEGINSKILTLQKCSQTLESCYTAVNKLITLDAVNSTAAYFFVETIVKECQRILCRQLHILNLLCGVQSYTERGTLNGVVASAIGTCAIGMNCNLMSAGQWYEEEEGIESRRALGLLCALCDVSSLASELTYGSKPLTNHCEEITNKTSLPNYKKEVPTTSNNFIAEDVQDDCHQEHFSRYQKKDTVSYREYLSKPFGFLHLLKDIVFSISFQRRTRQFIGILTGIVKLITAIAKNTILASGGLDLVTSIIRDIVFCRPQVEVVISLFELLASLAIYPEVMMSLCTNSNTKSFVDMKTIGLTYFTRESCVTQVLFRLLPTCGSSVFIQTELCYHMVKWLHTVVCFSGKESCWLLALMENRKISCNCRDVLASGLVTTLYNTLCDLDGFDSDDTEDTLSWKLHKSLRMSIILLRVWQQQDDEYWKYFVKENFSYQLFLAKIKIDLKKLELNDLERNCLAELLGKSEESSGVTAETEGEEDSEYWNIISNDSNKLFTDHR